jgi:diguanylate cyclase (GGDEF)-like protein
MQDRPTNETRVARSVYIAATAMVVAFVITIAFVIEQSSREADHFALNAELRLTRIEFDRIAADARRDQSEIAYWDDTVEALVSADSYDLDFVENEIVDWMMTNLGFSATMTVEPDGEIGVAVIEDQIFAKPGSMPLHDANADLVRAARDLYLAKRVMTSEGYMVPTGSQFLPGFSVSAYRFWENTPGIVTAQVIVPETPDYALPGDDGVVLLSFKPLTPQAIADIGTRLGLPGAEIVTAQPPGDIPSRIELPDGFGPSGMMFKWLPLAPRTAIITSAVPLAIGLCIVICSALFFIVRKHGRAMRALAESEERNRFMATHDPLTGLLNRAHFDDRLDSLTATPDQPSVAVMCIDLDRFKAVNDTHGHHAGDLILREVAKRLTNVIGDSGMVARVGGDEFIALVTRNVERDFLNWLGDAMIEAVCQPIGYQGLALEVGASVGVAFWPENGRTPHDVIVVADRLLYDSKQSGRGRTTIAGTAPVSPARKKFAS